MMFSKSDIRRITLAVPKKYYEELIYSIGLDENIHLLETVLPSPELTNMDAESCSSAIFRARRIFSSVSKLLKERDPDYAADFDFNPYIEDRELIFNRTGEDDEAGTVRIEKKLNQHSSVKKRIELEIEKSLIRRNEIRRLAAVSVDFQGLDSLKLCSYFFGRIPNGIIPSGIKNSWYLTRRGGFFLLVVPSGEEDEAAGLLGRYGFNDCKVLLPSGADVKGALKAYEARIAELRRRIDVIDRCLEQLEEDWSDFIYDMYGIYSVILNILSARAGLHFSEEIVFLAGWADTRSIPSLRRSVNGLCGDSWYLSIGPRGIQDPETRPVKLRNIRLFRPFETLIRIMGTPGNGELDPTPMAGIAYIVLFGLMFGDVGQGAVLAVTGAAVNRTFIKKKNQSAADMGSIIFFCGISAFFFGFLYGSVFSSESLLSPLWFHPMEHMMELFTAAVAVGAVLISAGMMLNIANRISLYMYDEAFFGTGGVAGLAVYLAMIYSAAVYLSADSSPDLSTSAVAVAAPLILFILRGPLSFVFFKSKKIFHRGFFEYIVESIVEIIEMFSSFLGNTISFVRAGAFALSHAGLSIAVYTLAEIVDPELSGPGAFSVIVLGNIFIILLEGLVCSIQSMRLEFYEFFSRFFQGNGAEFKPFTLKG